MLIHGMTVKSSLNVLPAANGASGSNNNFTNDSDNLLGTFGDNRSLRAPVVTEPMHNVELSAAQENTSASVACLVAVIIVNPGLFSMRF